MTLVKNINGTSDNICKCGSWLKHWEIFSGRKAVYCAENTCTKTVLLGAHVQKAGSSDDKWYIVPLCSMHNTSTSEIEVNTILVSANRNETCEK